MLTRFLRMLGACAGIAAAQSAGVFDSHGDVGETPKTGFLEFAEGEYRVTGGGANIWSTVDAFHFVWKKMSGDMAITADIRFIGQGVAAHRKAALMIRQGLEPDAAYADATVHGDGLTSLQYRPGKGAITAEIRSELKGPVRLRIERRGNQFTMLAGEPGGDLKPAGPATVTLTDPVYVGLAVCSHDAQVLETAVFSNVKIESLGSAVSQQRPPVRSKISIFDLKTRSTEVIY
jgi:TolB protein